MLPKPNRLPSSDIRRIMRTGRRVNAEGVQLVVALNNLSMSRFAFIVPVSVDTRAVVRNRVRRLLRESVRLILPSLAPARDGVFIVRKAWTDEFSSANVTVRELLRQVGILNKPQIT